jgi:UDP-glucose 4-epimerase
MHILITGASGLLGSRLAEHLQSKGNKVRLGSRLGTVPYTLPNCEVVVTDWQDDKSLLDACNGIDIVIHAAGMNASDSASNPLDAFIFNGVGSARLGLAAAKSQVHKVIYLSTAHVYSDPLVGKITEEVCAKNIHPYASSHLAGEFALRQATRNTAMQVLVLRLSNAFGHPLHADSNCWKLLVNDLCLQIIKNKKIKLLTKGTQWRDFIPIVNVCEILEKLLKKDINFNDIGILNVGGYAMPVFEMAKLVKSRADDFFGQSFLIERPENKISTQSHKLDYCCDRLINFLGPIKLEFDSEINSLLNFAKINFTCPIENL